MRIIAGEWRGRRIVAPAGLRTRPTADRVRETLFSMLVSRLGGFAGLAVGDFYAGSGALGFEALSRGAASCLFVDRDRAAVAAIEANARTLGTAAATVRAVPVAAIGKATAPLDLAMLDPPYGSDDIGAVLAQLVHQGWIGAGTLVSVETGAGEALDARGLVTIAGRRVGKAALHLLRFG